MHSTAIVTALALLSSSVWAESGVPQKAPARPAAQKAQPQPPSAAKPSAAKPPAAKPPASPVVQAPLGEQELDIAQRVHQGRLSCELGASVHIESDREQPGYFHVHGKGFGLGACGAQLTHQSLQLVHTARCHSHLGTRPGQQCREMVAQAAGRASHHHPFALQAEQGRQKLSIHHSGFPSWA